MTIFDIEGLKARFEEETGETLSNNRLSRELPIQYGQLLKYRRGKQKGMTFEMMSRFIGYFARHGVTITYNDLFLNKKDDQNELL